MSTMGGVPALWTGPHVCGRMSVRGTGAPFYRTSGNELSRAKGKPSLTEMELEAVQEVRNFSKRYVNGYIYCFYSNYSRSSEKRPLPLEMWAFSEFPLIWFEALKLGTFIRLLIHPKHSENNFNLYNRPIFVDVLNSHVYIKMWWRP